MAILNNNPLIGSGGNQGYNINNSLRFRASASAYLSRTPASAGSQTTWTWSAWVKRGALGIGRFLSAGSALSDQFGFNSSDNFQFVSDTTAHNLVTTQVFRDPSAWYHVVVAFDTTQATSANRIKLYVNGSQVTAFSTATYPAQNSTTLINGNTAQNIGRRLQTAGEYFDGYMTDINFIDGQALTPSSFGETDTTTGVWKPKAYTGTYGTNGFYLKFSDIATTSGSNAGLGKDFSGNSNYWTTNNISVTSGTTYDAMTDSPTNTSATVANYCVLNPIAKSSNHTLSAANLTDTISGSGACLGTFGVTSGKWYWEGYITTRGTDVQLGVANDFSATTSYLGATTASWGVICQNGNRIYNASQSSYGSAYADGDTFMIALDMDNGKWWAGKNGTWFASGDPAAGTNPAHSGLTGTMLPAIGSNSTSGNHSFNFGQRAFTYTPPTGFVALNTFNLPTITIVKGNTVMDATLYTGNGSTQTITNAAGFRPDFVWIKRRDGSGQDHVLQDSNRGFGGTKKLASSSTAAENVTGGATGSEWGSVTAANSNGFSITASTSGDQVNKNTWTYVGWQWQAGQGTNTTNTAGSITSTVSVNTTAGFSIVTYASSSGTNTVGHGLGVAPKMVIWKSRSNTTDWVSYHASLPASQYINLNSTAAAVTNNLVWNNTAPTSSVVTIGSDLSTYGNIVLYCWAEIAGFSRFGSYTGNGSTDGVFVYLGFRPKFIITKVYSTSGYNWNMYDSSRGTYNVADQVLVANGSGAEETGFDPIDFLSNGFKLRMGNRGSNVSGASYIYMAFAENPFKNSLAR